MKSHPVAHKPFAQAWEIPRQNIKIKQPMSDSKINDASYAITDWLDDLKKLSQGIMKCQNVLPLRD